MASRLHAPETGQPVRAHQRFRSQVPIGPGLQRLLAAIVAARLEAALAIGAAFRSD